jgi:organic hydroperoxide reductase OsmC/OhrA
MKEKKRFETDENLKNYDGRSLISPLLSITVEAAGPGETNNEIVRFWLPEHLYVASISDCLGAVFLTISRNSRLDHISFQSNAVGIVQEVEGKFLFKKIILQPIIKITMPEHIERTIKVIQMSKENCQAAKAVTTLISLEPNIIVQSREAV